MSLLSVFFFGSLGSFDSYVWPLFLNHILTSVIRSPEDVVRRLDALIADIKERYHRPSFENPDSSKGDVLVVAHGHILRAFAMRWVGKPLTETALILEAGGVGTLR